MSVGTTALDFGVLAGLVELAGVNYVAAVFFGTVVGALSNFFINRHWSFDVAHLGAHWQLVRFVPVQVGSSALQTLGVWALTDLARVEYLASKMIVAVGVYLLWNYPMNRFIVFRTAPAETASKRGA